MLNTTLTISMLVVIFAFCTTLVLCSAQPSTVPIKSLRSQPGTCPSEAEIENVRNELIQEAFSIGSQINPANSCADIPVNMSSGLYWILPAAGSPAVQVHCNFNHQCGPGAWTRVAFLNMSDPNQTCPSNWITISSPVRTCGRGRYAAAGCNSVFYSTLGLTFSRVCGRVIGYQHATPDAFDPLIHFNQQIDGYYVDGLSLTHGSPGSRQHIWTFAGAIGDMVLSDTYRCACSISHNWNFSTGFVGNDYFCDTGNHGNTWPHERFYSEDPLWDGAGCAPGTTCC